MPRITKVTTKTGDAGDTALATGRRVGKDHPRIEAYGTVDELSSLLGAVLAAGLDADLVPGLLAVQNELFHLGAELATPAGDGAARPGPRIEERHVERLERWQDEIAAQLPPLANFELPGGSPAAAQLQVARAVCRRAERRVVALAAAEAVPPLAVRYLNRLSDLLFTLARGENHRQGIAQPVWDSRA
jgi:cob(I)alamin adenosyltransferase